MTAFWRRWAHQGWQCWLGPVDPIRVDTFRVVLGIALGVYLLAWWRHAGEWLTPAGFHVSGDALRSVPVAPLLPAWALPWFGLALFGSLGAWILGWNARRAGWCVLAGVVYVSLADILSSYTLNKLFIVSLAVLACVPQGRYWTLTRATPRTQSVWPIRVLQATLILHYFLSGWAKAYHGDWLQHSEALWSHAQGYYRNDLAAWMLRTLPLGVWSWMQYAALTFELCSPILFMVRRFRPVGLLWGVAFQLLTALMMQDLIFFSLQMLSLYVLFLPDSLLHAVRLRLRSLISNPALP